MRFNKTSDEIIEQTNRLMAGSKYDPLKETLRQSLKLRLAIRNVVA